MTRELALLATFLFLTVGARSASAQDLEPPPALAPSVAPSPYVAPPTSPYLPPPGTPTSGPVYGARDTDESKDSGLGLEWVWINADIGADSMSMDSLNSSNLQLQKTSSFGPAFALGAGVRLLFFTAGARVRDLQLADFSLWEVDAEAAFHVRVDHVDPYFGVRGGYAFVGTLSADAVNSDASNLTVHGFNAGLMFGCDYYFNHFFSVGLEANPEFLFLQRPPVALPAGAEALLSPSQLSAYRQSGSSVGFGFTGTAHAGVHF